MKSTRDDKLSREDSQLFSKYINGTFQTWNLSRQTKHNNKNCTKTKTTPEFWKDFEKKTRDMGVDLIGYIPVMEDYIFYGLKVYGKNAVILGQEMEWKPIKEAPSLLTAMESMRLQYVLGNTVIELTTYLQEQGYKSESHVPFGGKLLVPPHVVAAHLGIKGQNGITVTPEFGPRQRWGIITTDAEIPETNKRDLSKLEMFCKNCGLCIKDCLGNAVYEKPIEKKGGVLTHIDWEKCIETLAEKSSCSVCLKVCPPGIPKKSISKDEFI
ncbi:MAG: hypothetical protein EU535_05055 [Promethearchaeota archaeon]|nr:MAG: hypothetical protein EU535_05055 [Candidatus Lokiarchaeota archaeon]